MPGWHPVLPRLSAVAVSGCSKQTSTLPPPQAAVCCNSSSHIKLIFIPLLWWWGGGINVDGHYKGFMYLFLKYEIIWNIAVTLSCRRVENTSTLQTAANRRSQSVTWNIGLDELCLFPVTVSHGDGQCYTSWRSSNIWHEVISVHSTIHECLSTCDVCVRLPKLKVSDSTASPPQRHGGFLSGLCNNNNILLVFLWFMFRLK